MSDIIEVKDVREATVTALQQDKALTKYRLAKELNLSTASHINNFITGETKKTRLSVQKLFYIKFNILIESFKESKEYQRMVEPTENKEIKI